MLSVMMIFVLLFGGVINASADKKDPPQEKKDKITHKDRKAAAARALFEGALNPLMVEAVAAPIIAGAPHYFSHPNYANSPLPTIETIPGADTYVGNLLSDRAYATDNSAGVFVVLPAPL